MRRLFTTIALVLLTIAVCHQVKADETNIRYLSKQAGLTNNQVTALVQDHNGYIWAGTTNGLNRIDGHEVYTWSDSNHPFHSMPIRAIEADKENDCLWVFGPRGLAGCFMLASNQLISHKTEKADTLLQYHHKGKLYMWQFGPGKRSSRTRLNKDRLVTETFSQAIVDVRTDEEGNDWLLTKRGLYLNGLEQQLPSTDSVVRIATYRNICLALTPREILVYNHSRRVARRTSFPNTFRRFASQCTDMAVWGDQLLVFTLDRIISYHILDNTFSSPSNVQLQNGHVLPESGEELYVYDGKGKLIRFGHEGSIHTLQLMPSGTAGQQTPQVVVLNDTTEAYATDGNGLFIFDLKKGKSTRHYRKETHGFIRDNRISVLLADHTGCLWVAAQQSGLACLDLTDSSDNPDSLLSPHIPQPLVTSITVDGEKSLINTDEMELFYTHNNVEWHFSCLAYDKMQQISYQYYLAGKDSTWQAPTAMHTAKYKELTPGKYTFHVRATTDGIHWGAESTHTIVINEPWWTRWPALLPVLAIFAAMGLFLYLIVYKFIHPERAVNERQQTVATFQQQEVLPAEEPQKQQSLQPQQQPQQVQLTAKEERFKRLLEDLLELHIEETDFGVEEFAACANLKRTQFYTKVKRITGLSPIELLRKAHLEHAARLLKETDLNIDEVRERCGFSNSTTFYNYFKQQYGMTPRQYRNQA